MPQIVQPPEQNEYEHPGFQIVRWLRPGGAALVLILFVLFLVQCFTAGRDPIPGYTAPHDTAYYAAHLDELAAELNANVLPQLDEKATAAVTGDKVTVTAAEDTFATTRAAVCRYFDRTLLIFESKAL